MKSRTHPRKTWGTMITDKDEWTSNPQVILQLIKTYWSTIFCPEKEPPSWEKYKAKYANHIKQHPWPNNPITPEEWINKYIGLLGCRDLGDDEIISEIQNSMIEEYPYFSPIGTGMCIRKSVFLTYLKEIENNDFRKNLGRKGNALTSGEDNDIVITALKSGWQVGYFPQLQIEHLIPQRRTSRDYLGSMNFAQNKSWIQLLRFHDICPWKPILRWTVPFRKLRSFFINKTWKSKEQLIKWKGCCGLFEALAK